MNDFPMSAAGMRLLTNQFLYTPYSSVMLNPQPLPPGGFAMLNPQPLPPRVFRRYMVR